MKYIVRARSINNKTGKETIRDEEINTSTNVLFKGCQNFQEVADKYQAFWDMDILHERVAVIGVFPVVNKIKKCKGDPEVKVKSHWRR